MLHFTQNVMYGMESVFSEATSDTFFVIHLLIHHVWPFLTSQTIFARDFRVLSRTPSWCFGLVFEAVTGHIWFIFPEKQQMTERAELSFSSFSSVWICDDRNAGQVLSRFMLLLLRHGLIHLRQPARSHPVWWCHDIKMPECSKVKLFPSAQAWDQI